MRRELLVERVHAGPHRQIQCHRSVLDEDAAVAAAAQRDVGAVGRDEPAEHTVVAVARVEITNGNDARRSMSIVRSDGALSARTGTNRTVSPGRHLAELPAVAADHRHRADEPAEAGSVGAEQDRGVAGEVQCANAVRVVVDVRRMQPGLAAVGAGPLRLRPLEAHTGAVGVEVHRVVGADERVDVGAGEELRRPVRSLGHRDLPAVPDAGLLFDRRARGSARASRADAGAQHVAGHAAAGRRGRRTRRA